MANALSRMRKRLGKEREAGAVIICALCKEPVTDFISIDHIIPKAKGGTMAVANLQPTHVECNMAKADTIVSDLESLGSADSTDVTNPPRGASGTAEETA